jgi:protein SCO1/2
MGLVVLAIGSAVLLQSYRTAPDGDRTFPVTGVVMGVNQDGTITVAHDEISGLMPAMTMPFTPTDAAAGTSLTPGDRIEFTLRVGSERTRIEDITLKGRSAVVDRSRMEPSRPSSRLRPGDALPSFQLVNQSGAPLTDTDLRGQRTIVTFIYTRCPLPEFCPRIVSRYMELQKTITSSGPLADVHLLAVSLDPEYDTPPVLEAYGRSLGANFDRWTFATGSTAEVTALTRAFAVHVEQSGVLPDHTLATALFDTEGRLVEIWRGNFWETQEVLDALRAPTGAAAAPAPGA